MPEALQSRNGNSVWTRWLFGLLIGILIVVNGGLATALLGTHALSIETRTKADALERFLMLRLDEMQQRLDRIDTKLERIVAEHKETPK